MLCTLHTNYVVCVHVAVCAGKRGSHYKNSLCNTVLVYVLCKALHVIVMNTMIQHDSYYNCAPILQLKHDIGSQVAEVKEGKKFLRVVVYKGGRNAV